MQRMLLVLALLAPASWIACTEQASSPTETTQPQAQTPPLEPAQLTASGTLAKVDPAMQLLWMQAPDGSQMQFRYSDQTRVMGAQNTIEGLDKLSGAHVRIQYEDQGGANTALEIDVEQPQQ